jgi:hypothetical protein
MLLRWSISHIQTYNFGVLGRVIVTCFSFFSADSEPFPIIATGQNLHSYSDGAMYSWVRNSKGYLNRSSSPICVIEVIAYALVLTIQCNGVQSKSPNEVVAQEAALLIAFGTSNRQAKVPYVRPRDEVLINNLVADCFRPSHSVVMEHASTSLLQL